MRHLLFCICFLFAAHSLTAQSIERDVLSNSGDFFTTSDLTVAWTLGELSIETYENNDITLTQGFHQLNISITGIFDHTAAYDGLASLYPNPTQDVVYFEMKTQEQVSAVELYDAYGKLVVRKRLNASVEKSFLDLSAYADGTYLMKFSFKGQPISKAYRIIKN